MNASWLCYNLFGCLDIHSEEAFCEFPNHKLNSFCIWENVVGRLTRWLSQDASKSRDIDGFKKYIGGLVSGYRSGWTHSDLPSDVSDVRGEDRRSS